MTYRSYRQLERIVKVNRRDTLGDITSKFNENREHRVSRSTIQYNLNKHGFNKFTGKKVVVKEINRKKRLA